MSYHQMLFSNALGSLIAAALFLPAAQAAPLPPSPSCKIVGTIVKIEDRREPCRDSLLCEMFGRQAYEDYVDVTVLIAESDLTPNQNLGAFSAGQLTSACAFKADRERVFQVWDGALSADYIDQTITATVQHAGDEFRSGSWISNIKSAADIAPASTIQ